MVDACLQCIYQIHCANCMQGFKCETPTLYIYIYIYYISLYIQTNHLTRKILSRKKACIQEKKFNQEIFDRKLIQEKEKTRKGRTGFCPFGTFPIFLGFSRFGDFSRSVLFLFLGVSSRCHAKGGTTKGGSGRA